MHAYSFNSGAEALFRMSYAAIMDGNVVHVRGQKTYELRNTIIEITDPTDVLCTGMNRKMNLALGYAEGLQLIGGFSDPVRLAEIAPNTKQFQDHGSFHGAYGPRIKMQLPRIIEKLRADPTTRQAVVTIWDPLHDLMTEKSNDYPCTIGFNFSIRGGSLHMTTHMRSNDVWWGWTYDVVQFCMLQTTIASVLKIPVGTYTHFVDSFHLYARDAEASGKLTEPGPKSSRRLISGLPGYQWSTARALAQKAFDGDWIANDEFLLHVTDVMSRG